MFLLKPQKLSPKKVSNEKKTDFKEIWLTASDQRPRTVPNLGVEGGEAPAARGGVEVLTGVLQTRPALLPLRLQRVFAALLRLLQLLRHLLRQLCGPLGGGGEAFSISSSSVWCSASHLTFFLSTLCLKDFIRCSCFCSFFHMTSFSCFTPYRALLSSSSTSVSPSRDNSDINGSEKNKQTSQFDETLPILNSRFRMSEAGSGWSAGEHSRTLRFTSSSVTPSRSFILVQCLMGKTEVRPRPLVLEEKRSFQIHICRSTWPLTWVKLTEGFQTGRLSYTNKPPEGANI